MKILFLAAACLCLIANSAVSQNHANSIKKNKVIVMGMVHAQHVHSESYGLERVKQIIRRIEPDFVFCEIPPDRIEAAVKEFQETGRITETRVRVFPEYVDALLPLTKELEFEIVPCAAWTQSMSDARQQKMLELKTTHPTEFKQMTDAQQNAEMQIQAKGGGENPEFIHTDEYDKIVKHGMTPYNEHFNQILGAGGWENINAAHFKLIEKNLDERANRGYTILIMFGAWHKYWFLEKLRQRDDIELINLNEYLKSDSPSADSPSSIEIK